ncbi:MAG: toxin-antitoxin system YwqK family antitoxin [Cytophagaceae bacterium]
MKTLVLWTFCSLVFLHQGYTCSCTGYPKNSNSEITLEWYNDFEFVFTARIDSVLTEDTKYIQTTFLTPLTIYKGQRMSKMVNGYHQYSSCNFNLAPHVGDTFIIYGRRNEQGDLTSHFCAGTKKIYSEKELDTLQVIDYLLLSYKHELRFLAEVQKVKSGYVDVRYSNGNSNGKGRFENGIPIGKWTYFIFDGRMLAEGNFLNGEKVGEWIENQYYENYDPDENKLSYKHTDFSRGQYLNGLKEGEWKFYRPNGEYSYSVEYLRGERRK